LNKASKMKIRGLFLLVILGCSLILACYGLWGRDVGEFQARGPDVGEKQKVRVKDAEVIQDQPGYTERAKQAAGVGQQYPSQIYPTEQERPSQGILSKLGESLGMGHKKEPTYVEQAAQTVKEAADRAGQTVDEYIHGMQQGMQAPGAVGGPGIGQRVGETLSGAPQAVSEKVSGATQGMKDTAYQAAETTRQVGGKLAEAGKVTAQRAGGALRGVLDLSGFSQMWPSSYWPFKTITGLSASADVKESPREFLIRLDIPGVDSNNIKINLDERLLTISGFREHEEDLSDEHYHLYEREYGEFRRAFRLPEGVDPRGIRALYDNGVLEVVVPKILSQQVRETLTIPISFLDPTQRRHPEQQSKSWKLPFMG
jgi:HSP20 family protein